MPVVGSRSLAALSALSAAVVGVLTTVLVSSDSAPDYAFAAGLVGFGICGPLLIWRFSRQGEGLSLLSLVTGFFLLEYAAGGLFYREPREDSVLAGIRGAYTSDDMGYALLLAFVAWLAIVAGYMAVSYAFQLKPRQAVRQLTSTQTRGYVVALLAIGYAARLFTIQQGWYFHISDAPVAESAVRNIVVILGNLPLLATALVGLNHYRVSPTKLYPIMLALEVAWALPSGERSRIVAVVASALIVRYYSAKQPISRRVLVVVTAVLVLVVFPFGAAYRTSSGTVTGYQKDPGAQMQAAAKQLAADFPEKTFTDGTDQTLRRFAGITSLAAIVNRSTDIYPAEPGFAVQTYLSALVPRALLPTKADPSGLTNDFGVAYSIIRPGNTAAVAMTQVGDVWGTFGFAGLLVGMLTVGAALRGLEFWFAARRTDALRLATYATFIGGFLLGFETSVAVGFIQSLRELLVYVLVTGAIGLGLGVRRTFPSPRGAQQVAQ